MPKTFIETECPQCHGKTFVIRDRPVADYMRGGYIDAVSEVCDLCEGFGTIVEFKESDDER